ncbi:hypothetical protein FN846DRAFT_778682, partial [Sphaerosporella brunnea]
MTSSHQIAIAKASLAACLLRADPVPISRDEISNFHNLLEKALTVCSPANIQNCKRWILNNMATPGRIAGLAKYLAALSPGLADSTTPSGKKSSARRKRVHILYLINDVLHQTKYLLWDNGAFAEGIRPALPGLFATAMYPKAVKQLAKLERLLAIWDSKQYYPHVFIEELRTAIKDAAAAKDSAAGEAGTRTKQKVQLLPPFHGDPSIPFYDLPAGNLLPLITPNSTAPINSRLVKPVQFASITPEPKLVAAVQDFLTSVDMMFAGQDAGEEPDSV